uniref:OAR domain-containing protein n=1 Tax=Echinostoma caproni TaxID=27848 RepID=A0A183BBU2_9TREM
LNRIVGDAFQLAYARQRMLKLQRSGTKMLSPDTQPIPHLCDRYNPWSYQTSDESGANECNNGTGNNAPTNTNNNPSPAHIPLMLELPPPPSCPPPPPMGTDPNGSLAHCSSSPELTTTPISGTNGLVLSPVSQNTTNGVSPTCTGTSDSNFFFATNRDVTNSDANGHMHSQNKTNGLNSSDDLESR